MATQAFTEFHGLDTRRIESLSDMRTARVAKNLYLSSGRVWRTRPGTKLVARLPQETKGLYAGQGVLRTVAPAGYADIFNRQTPKVFFDFVGDGTVYDRDDIAEFINAERFGASVAAGVQPYAVIRRRSTGRLEHYWFRDRPDTPNGGVNTRVSLPFVPTGQILKLAEKLWAPDQVNGAVRFSSTEFGPSDWTTVEDAGFLPVFANAPGDHTITALSFMQSTAGALNTRQSALVVFFEDSIQIWAVDPNPINHYLTSILGGVGTENFRSVANVYGDPVFLSREGFSSLRISARDGALDSARIGAPIERLTRGLDAGTVTASVWWDSKGLYLCAVGSDIFAWRYDPAAKVQAWSQWALPYGRITDFVDFASELYFRTETGEVYRMDDGLDTDSGAAIPFDLETQFLHMGSPGAYKTFQSLQLYQTGGCDLSYRPDPTEPDMEIQVYATSGVTRPHQKVPLIAMCDSMALRFQGAGAWELSGFAIDYTITGR
jgi:hypothetical protein